MMTMTIYLADTSVWIDYLRHSNSPLRPHVHDNSAGHTEPVAVELLSGTTSEASTREVDRLLRRSPLLAFDSVADFPAATEIRRRALREGLRVGVIDCLILAVAGRRAATLITRDRPQATLGNLLGIGVVRLEV